MYRLLWILVLISISVLPAAAQDSPLRVIATTSLIADAALHVGGNLVHVDALVPPDTDIHAFQPEPQDVVAMTEADLLLVNGAGLESFLSGIEENIDPSRIVVVSEGIAMLPFGSEAHGAEHAEGEEHTEDEYVGILGEDGVCGDGHSHDEVSAVDEHDHGQCDPHVWTDPANVAIWVQNIADAFTEADSDNGEVYQANADAYILELEALAEEIEIALAAVPVEKRILVTNHEFLAYFAHAYGFEVVGVVIPGGSTDAEPGPQEIASLIDLIRAEGVPAIFTEQSANTDLAQTVAQEAGAVAVTSLRSDSLGDAGSGAETYVGYMRTNVASIVGGLSQ